MMVFSYLDYSHKTCKILIFLNKRFNSIAASKSDDSLNMLPKAVFEFEQTSQLSLTDFLGDTNLCHYTPHIKVTAVHLT
jgi:hypothetical protein